MTFNSYIPIDLTAKGEKVITIAACKSLWLPKAVIQGQAVVQNPQDAVIGIRFGDFSEMMPFGIADGLTLTAQGSFTQIRVTVLTKGAGTVLYLASGSGIGVAPGNVDGLSAEVSAPSEINSAGTRNGNGDSTSE